jgi:hypothetical protein
VTRTLNEARQIMRQAERITLFIHDRDGRLEPVPDLQVLHALLAQTPLLNPNPDGSRTFIFDLGMPSLNLPEPPAAAPRPSLEGVRNLSAALAEAARAIGLRRTASLADSIELLAEAEAAQLVPPMGSH